MTEMRAAFVHPMGAHSYHRGPHLFNLDQAEIVAARSFLSIGREATLNALSRYYGNPVFHAFKRPYNVAEVDRFGSRTGVISCGFAVESVVEVGLNEEVVPARLKMALQPGVRFTSCIPIPDNFMPGMETDEMITSLREEVLRKAQGNREQYRAAALELIYNNLVEISQSA
ncbi:MAG: hypothetical protein WC645_06805 [Candidatus Margulisiibacteriota bacterium]